MHPILTRRGGALTIMSGMTTVEHAIPIPKLYDDVLIFVGKSGTGNTPTHVVNYGGVFGETYVWVSASTVVATITGLTCISMGC